MLLYPVRRFHRPLLFPPSLLALGFLLLLGCLALRPWYPALEPRYMLELTVPPKPTSDYIFFQVSSQSGIHEWLQIGETERISNFAERLERYSQLPYFRSWQDFAFTGVLEQDLTTANEARLAMRVMQTDTMHAKGIRIRFAKQATYASLVQGLEWANSATETYLLDIHHTPVTLYAFTNVYKSPVLADGILYPNKAPVPFGCGTAYYDVIDKKPLASFGGQMQNWLTRWQQARSEAFSSSAWQLPILFLLGIIALSSWKMARRWHTA
ncbi:hypothetical protein [Hymenobacter lucidus]|uniref:Uncharacterized protein n=1 Tax=Hymenobacter lucidus TaxID=2880930 RepID=A0ABS8API8_9BACT|nr:hypothetical protein [Hymenobacter lucidus]MCB2408128.1 hypothetical protein [Hymenobacter lucidus]